MAPTGGWAAQADVDRLASGSRYGRGSHGKVLVPLSAPADALLADAAAVVGSIEVGPALCAVGVTAITSDEKGTIFNRRSGPGVAAGALYSAHRRPASPHGGCSGGGRGGDRRRHCWREPGRRLPRLGCCVSSVQTKTGEAADSDMPVIAIIFLTMQQQTEEAVFGATAASWTPAAPVGVMSTSAHLDVDQHGAEAALSHMLVLPAAPTNALPADGEVVVATVGAVPAVATVGARLAAAYQPGSARMGEVPNLRVVSTSLTDQWPADADKAKATDKAEADDCKLPVVSAVPMDKRPSDAAALWETDMGTTTPRAVFAGLTAADEADTLHNWAAAKGNLPVLFAAPADVRHPEAAPVAVTGLAAAAVADDSAKTVAADQSVAANTAKAACGK